MTERSYALSYLTKGKKKITTLEVQFSPLWIECRMEKTEELRNQQENFLLPIIRSGIK